MKSQTKETLFQVLVSAAVSAVVIVLFSRYKDKLPSCISKHFKE